MKFFLYTFIAGAVSIYLTNRLLKRFHAACEGRDYHMAKTLVTEDPVVEGHYRRYWMFAIIQTGVIFAGFALAVYLFGV